MCSSLPVLAQTDTDDASGRDFPKTLIFDEPGIDDEVSLPTLIVIPTRAGTETDVNIELDKRLTTWVSLQLNVGYTAIAEPGGNADGWQNTDATLKWVLLADKPQERLISLSTIHEFGGTGALQIGAPRGGYTAAALNFGQGLSPLSDAPWIKPFAVTGTAGYLVPDTGRYGEAQQVLISTSLQYSLDVLSRSVQQLRFPAIARPLIPIVEITYAAPTIGQQAARGFAAPGLIYSGDGFQLAAEALVPLTRDSGTHVGAIMQLNLSLSLLPLGALSQPIF